MMHDLTSTGSGATPATDGAARFPAASPTTPPDIDPAGLATPAQAPARPATGTFAWVLLAPLIAGILAYAGIAPVHQVLDRFDLASAPNPYFLPGDGLMLYLVVPLATLALAAFVMAPGLLLAAASGRVKGVAEWLLTGLAFSLALLLPATALAQLAAGTVLRGGAFLLVVAVMAALAAIVPLRRLTTGRPLTVDFAGQKLDLVFTVIVPLVTLLAFSAKFYWENFSPDGSGGLQFNRLFIATLWPFWPPSAGTVGQAPDLTSVMFVAPGSWFLRTWGEYEYSVRAPMLLYLGLLHPLIIALIRFGRGHGEAALPAQAITLADHLLIGAILLLYTLALVYSGGYHPWFNDSPMPAVRETLALVAFLGYALFIYRRQIGWTAAFAVMSYMSIPTGMMWVLLVPLAALVVALLPARFAPRNDPAGPRGQRRPGPALVPAFAIFAALMLASLLAPPVIRLLGLPLPGYEFSSGAIVDRIRYISLADWERFAYLLVPGGIVPAIALFCWKRQDSLSRTLTVTTAVMFAFFYLQGYRVLLHHFVPAMLLPAIVYWRTLVLGGANGEQPTRWGAAARWRLAALGGIVLATVLAWPVQMRLHTHDRAFAASIATRGPQFETAAPAPGEKFHGFNPVALDIVHELLPVAFPPDYSQDGPARVFFGGPHVWFYYAQFPKPAGFVPQYDIRPLDLPGQGTLYARHLGYGLFVRDKQQYLRDRTLQLPINTGAPLLATERDIIFGRGPRHGERVVVDLVGVVKNVLGIAKAPARKPAHAKVS